MIEWGKVYRTWGEMGVLGDSRLSSLRKTKIGNGIHVISHGFSSGSLQGIIHPQSFTQGRTKTDLVNPCLVPLSI